MNPQDRADRFRNILAFFLVAALYIRRWLAPNALPAPVFSPRALAWLEALADWMPVPAEALSAV